MAAQNGLDFEGEFNNAIDGLFKNNTSRDISPTDQRVLVTSIRESYVNRTDDIVDEDAMTSNSSTKIPSQQSVKAYVDGLAVTQEFNRAWSEEIIFNKNEIFYALHELDDDVNYTIASSGNLTDKSSGVRQRIITDGTHAITFGAGFDFLYGITNGEILEAGNYEIYFIYTNGSVSVNIPGTSQQTSGLTQLIAPANLNVVPDGENALDITWSDVSNEVEYQLERSTTGTSGWTLFSNPAANATSDTETGLNPGDTVYYRIKAIGDGISKSDSPYSTVSSGTTEDTGDVTAPTFTFNPANGTSVWPVNKPFTITANEPLLKDDGTVLTSGASNIIILKQTNSGGTDISHTWTIDASKTVITITPTTTLGTTQLVYVSINNVEDASGNESSLTSITFTTTAYTYYNGASNRMTFGNILGGVFSINDTNFWLERTLKNPNFSGSRVIWSKLTAGTTGNASFRWYYNGTAVVFYYQLSNSSVRGVLWTGTSMNSSGENILVLKYDGSIDTNDGLDRCTLLINGVTQTGAVLSNPAGALNGTLDSTTSYLSCGVSVNGSGVPSDTLWYEGEAKNSIIRSASGATVELNVAVDRVGTDSSGNSRNGTWT